MRVIQLGPVPPPHGGVSTNMLAIHDALINAGHRSSIVDVTSRGRRQGIDHVYEPASPIDLIRYLIRSDSDIVHYHVGGDFSAKLALLARACGSLPGKKAVLTFHSGGFARVHAETARPMSLQGSAFRSVDMLIGVNEQMIRMFHRYGVHPSRCKLILPYDLRSPDPAVTIPANLERFIRNCGPFLISIGALEPEYQNGKLIDAMRVIRKKLPLAGLMIVGAGSETALLESQIQDCGLSESVVVTGSLDRDVVLHLLRRAEIMFRLTEYDGDAISIRESMFLGTPVIATDNALRPDGVFLVQTAFTPETLLETIEKARDSHFCGNSGTLADRGNILKVIDEYVRLLNE